MPKQQENRTYTLAELRADRSADGTAIEGYAALFGTLSSDLGGFREQIAPGAFDESLDDDIRAYWNHDRNFLLGRTSSGTLRVWTDEQGLRFRVQPPETSWSRDLMVSIERGDVDQASFAFHTLEDGWETKGGAQVRTLKKVRLLDVSPVAEPAYPDTSVGLRSLKRYLEAVPEGPQNQARRAQQRHAETKQARPPGRPLSRGKLL